MHDLVIRNGKVIDGTGAPERIADVVVDGAHISAVGAGLGPGKREIDANGNLVLPGWVDIHSHYDGQATWDSHLTPSSWHGVTTTVFGNCGVGVAPVRPGDEDFLIGLMEAVEDIPAEVLAAGMDFRWHSFADYLDALAAMPRIMDIGAQVAHAPLRVHAMGQRGADHDAAPSQDELAEMARMLEESLAAGALGFTTSRTHKHKAGDGRPVPSYTARQAELMGLADAMRRADAGVIQCNSDLAEGDFAVLQAMAERAGRPLSLLLLQIDADPDRWRRTLADIEAANAAGLDVKGQVGCRPIGVLMGLDSSINPFLGHPAWAELEDLTPEGRRQRLAADENLRRRLVEERPDDARTRWLADGLSKCFEFTDPPTFEPEAAEKIVNRAEAAGQDPWGLALDILRRDDGLLFWPFENYSEGSLDVLREMLLSEHTVCGLGDGGAHVATICDASYPTTLLTHWARDRMRGPGLPLEFLVRKQTALAAQSYGMNDRGILAPGYKADINLVDLDALGVTRPALAYDLPAGGRRFVQRSLGYRHTFVSGVEVAADGEHTGALPGGLVRGAQSGPQASRTAAE
ncbi:MAG: amidohydrolase family protein [Alphaproteobacteria bacterium]|jgi:N-acyl-D-aspartate/D-glutamate deacylase|nr:amidohydrolase family protein [Alphaproteobacteria bacterium]